MPVEWIMITLAIAVVLAVVVGVLYGASEKDAVEGGGATFAALVLLLNVWFWGWIVYIAVHFISKAW